MSHISVWMTTPEFCQQIDMCVYKQIELYHEDDGVSAGSWYVGSHTRHCCWPAYFIKLMIYFHNLVVSRFRADTRPISSCVRSCRFLNGTSWVISNETPFTELVLVVIWWGWVVGCIKAHIRAEERPSLRESEEGVDAAAAAVGNDKRYCDSPTDIVEKRVHPRTVMENPFARRRI